MTTLTNEHSVMANNPEEIRKAVSKLLAELGEDLEVTVGPLTVRAKNVTLLNDDALQALGSVEIYPRY